MRTKAAGAAAIIANPSHGGLVKVSVYDAGGANPTDLSALTFAVDPVLEVSITEAVDQSRTATVVLQRQQGARSLAPLVTNGNPLGGTVVDVGRRIVITCAVVPPDSESFYEAPTIFDGYVDEVAWPEDTLTLTCTDKTAKLRDTWIEVERAYGFATGASATKGTLVWAANAVVAVNDLVVPSQSLGNGHFYKVSAGSGSVGSTEPTWPTGSGSTVALGGITYTEVGAVNETGTAVETIIQQVLNDNGLGSLVTLQTPVSPSWLIRPYIQQRQSVADAVQGLVNQLGWRCRFEWSSGLGRYELTLRQPNRGATNPDKVLLPQEELRTTSLGVDVYSIRNVVRVAYSDTAARGSNGVVPRKFAESSDSTSITKYGRRYCEVSEADTSQIDSSTEAQRMAQAMVDDLKEPTLPMGVVFPVDPYLEINDMVQLSADNLRFSAAQTLAVDSLTHRFSQGDATTKVHLRGKPASNRAGWLELEGRAKPSGVLPTSALDTVSATVSTSSSVVGGVCITLTYSLMKGASPPLVEVHISASGGFTPDATTLKASGQATSFTVAQLVPGKAYFGRIVPVLTDASGATVRGSPGVEFSFTAGQAQAGHYSSTVTQSHLPLNGNFEHATDDLASVPPDHWRVEALGGEPAESWGASGSVYYGTEASTHGRFITLRNTAARGRVVSAPFEIRRTPGNWTANLSISIRRGGANGGPNVRAVLFVYADAALTSLVGSTTLSTVLSGPLGAWNNIELAASVLSGNFGVLELSRTTVGDTTVYFDIGEVFIGCGNFTQIDVQDLNVGHLAANASATLASATITAGTIGAEAWTAASYLNSWVDYGSGLAGAAYYKEPGGKVNLGGVVKNATGANRFTAIFNLPAAYRPATNKYVAICAGATARWARLAVTTGGDVFIDTADSATPETGVILDSVSFDLRR